MYCKSCGKVIPDGTDYCSECAQSVPSVTMGEALKLFFSNYANFRGRARRSEYWKGIIAVSLITGLISGLMYGVMMASEALAGVVAIAYIIWGLAIIIPCLSIIVRRLHDTGHSGWCYFCYLIPLIGGILLFVWMCTDSTADNQWGPNPKFRPVRRQIPTPRPTPAPDPAPAFVPDDIPMTALPTAAQQLHISSGTPASAPKSAGFSATLLLCTGPMAGKQITCRPGERVILGRSQSGANHVLTGYDKVSGTHCRIEVSGNTVTVTDLGSTNGTKVGAQKLTPNMPVTVPHGGIIFLADNNCAFQVKYN